MNITREQIDHLAELSNSELNELDTEGVEPTYQVFEMENVWREDEILSQDADREKLLATAPAFRGKSGVEDYQIKVPKVL